jgi:hypothetical protein
MHALANTYENITKCTQKKLIIESKKRSFARLQKRHSTADAATAAAGCMRFLAV